jgi:hypothetical protein
LPIQQVRTAKNRAVTKIIELFGEHGIDGNHVREIAEDDAEPFDERVAKPPEPPTLSEEFDATFYREA